MSSLVQSLAHLLLTGVSVLIVAAILPGMAVKSFRSAVAFAFVVGILNALAWHFVPIAWATWFVGLVTFGIGGLIVNGVLFLLAAKLVGGVRFSGCLTAALASLAVAAVNWAIHFIVPIGWAP